MDSSSTKPADEWSDDEGDLVNEVRDRLKCLKIIFKFH